MKRPVEIHSVTLASRENYNKKFLFFFAGVLHNAGIA